MMYHLLQVQTKISILLPWDTGEYFSNSDLVLGPIYFVMLLLVAFFTRNIFVKDPEIKKYFFPALLAKMFGSVMVGLVYAFYYKGGDTSNYFYDSSVFFQTFIESPSAFFKILFNTNNYFEPAVYDFAIQFRFIHDPQSFMVSKITGILSLLSFRTYIGVSLFYAFFSFSGVWALFTTFCKIYPNLKRQFAIAVLFIPSVCFWGSGILKDAITFSCVGWMTFCIYNLFFARRRQFLSIFMLVFTAWLCASIKGYIVLSILPPFLIWIFLNFRERIKSRFFRSISTPLILGGSALGAFLMIKVLGSSFEKYSLNNFQETAEVYQTSNSVNVSGDQASVYDIGQKNFDGSVGSFAKILPLAINVTLFRPYLWDVRNPIMVLSAFESTFFLLFTLRILFRTGLGGFYRSIIRNSFVFFCMTYSMLFAFAVGFTAANFGALVRYKIPCIPFFLAALYVMDYETKQQKARQAKFKSSRLQVQPPESQPSV